VNGNELRIEMGKLLERWKEAHEFVMSDLVKEVIASQAADLRLVLAGAKVAELAPIISQEDREAKKHTMLAVEQIRKPTPGGSN
jgi:hypothetical protein